MKKLWFHSLALALGLISTTAVAQYAPTDNFGPSSYPVLTQAAPQQGPLRSLLHNLPQVPQGFNAQAPTSAFVPQGGQYQLVGTQEQVYGGAAAQPVIQNIAPAVQQHAPMSPAAPMAQPQMGQPQMTQPPIASAQTNIGPMNNAPVSGAPGCQSCTPPVTGYAGPVAPQPTYGYAPASIAPNCTSCGPAPVSQNYNYAAPAAAAGRAKPWFFGAGLLLFNRVDNKSIPLSLADAAYSPDILTTRDARHGTAAGFEGTIGRYFNCGRNAIAATYWGVFPDDVEALRARSTAGDYRSRIPFTYMTMAGTPAAPGTPYPIYDWYDAAFTHTLQRSSEYHNVEVNLLGFAVGCAARNFNRSTAGSLFSGLGGRGHKSCGYCGGAGCGHCASTCGTNCQPTKFATGPCGLRAPACGSRLNVSWLAGIRYFRFEDNLLYAASLDDTVINRGADDIYYEVNTTNDLVGFQLGSRADYCVGRRINLYGAGKVGIYNNRSTLFTRLGTDFDYAYLADTRTPANPNNGQDYLFDETKNQVAFLSEMAAGVGVRMSSKWTATVGYRAVIAAGVATAPDNVRTSFANYDDVRNFDNYGTLILHGINVGAIYNY